MLRMHTQNSWQQHHTWPGTKVLLRSIAILQNSPRTVYKLNPLNSVVLFLLKLLERARTAMQVYVSNLFSVDCRIQALFITYDMICIP